MLFWHRLSLVRLAPTISLINVGQCFGHSCFKIWTHTLQNLEYCGHCVDVYSEASCYKSLTHLTCTNIILSFPMYTFSFCKEAEDSINKQQQEDHKQKKIKVSRTSTLAASDEVLIMSPTTYFLMPKIKQSERVSVLTARQHKTSWLPHPDGSRPVSEDLLLSFHVHICISTLKICWLFSHVNTQTQETG